MTEQEKHHDSAHHERHEGAQKEHHEHKEHHGDARHEHHAGAEKGKVLGMESGALMVAVAFLIIGLIVGAAAAFGVASSNAAIQAATQGTIAGSGADTSALEKNVENYVNANLLPADQGVKASVNSATYVGSGWYKLNFELSQDGTLVQKGIFFLQDSNLYAGSFLADMNSNKGALPAEGQANIAKSDKPAVNLFIMAFCPFGVQAVEAFSPAAKLLGDSIDFSLNYVLYSNFASQYGADWNAYCSDANETYCSMHGIGELREDVRQMCIQKHQKDKLWSYMDLMVSEYNAGKVSAANIDSKWKGYAATAGVDVAKVESCVASETDALLAEQAALSARFGVQGSPTPLINGTQYTGGRTAEAFKASVCSAFNTAPASCSQALDSAAAAAPSGGCATPQ